MSHYDRGAREERARIVAWMRRLASVADAFPFGLHDEQAVKIARAALLFIADLVERGEHDVSP